MLSIIVPVFNVAEYLQQCIQCLQDQTGANSEYELIFVDNGSTDGSLEILKGTPGIKLYQESKPGSYAARNRGIAAATGEILVFTDPDCFPLPSWLAAIENEFSRPEVQVCLGPRLPPRSRSSMRLLAAYENAKTKLVCATNDPMVYFGHTNNMAVRRSCIERCGQFVERMRGSDTIFVRQVVDAYSCRAVIYSERAAVIHAELESLSAYLGKVRTYSRSRRAYGHIMKVRPLNRRERIDAFKNTVRGRPVHEAAQLISQLALGAAAWWLGGINRTTTQR